MKTIIMALGMTLGSTAFSLQSAERQNPLDVATLGIGDQTGNCFNVSGTWKGTCEITSVGVESTVNVVQKETEMTFSQTGCALIEATQFGKSYVGAVKTESLSSKTGVKTETGASYWMDDGKKLGMTQSFSLVKFGEDGTITAGKVFGEFSLKDNALAGTIGEKMQIFDMKGKTLSNIDKTSRCLLIRQ